MKHIVLLLVVFCLFSSISAEKKQKKDIGDFPLVLEYLGSCDQFNTVDYPQLYASNFEQGSCLPIKLEDDFPDDAELTTTYVCTQVSEGKALIHFISIGTTNTKWAISFKPSNPFRALGENRYARRPSCEVAKDYRTTFDFVYSCSDNYVELKGAYVINSDRIYIFPPDVSPSTCITQVAGVTQACPYINTLDGNGYCEYIATQDLLNLDTPFIQKDDHHSYILSSNGYDKK